MQTTQRRNTSVGLDRDRQIFNKISRKMKAQQYDGVISQRTIRTEVYLENGKTDYSLQLKDNAPKLRQEGNRELRLKEQDAFVFTGFRMGLLLETVAGPFGHEETHTFNSAVPFADEVGGFQNSHLNVVYNGSLYLKVGTTVYLEDYSVSECRCARTQQQTSTLKSERFADDGFVNLTPQFTIRGFENNDLRFKMPSNNISLKTQYTATYKTVLVFEFKGFVITGAGTNDKLRFDFN